MKETFTLMDSHSAMGRVRARVFVVVLFPSFSFACLVRNYFTVNPSLRVSVFLIFIREWGTKRSAHGKTPIEWIYN